MLGTATILALLALWVLRPWLGAMRHLAERRKQVEDWGPALTQPPAGAEEEPVILRGRLEADGPVAHLPGPEAVAATLQGSPAGDGHLAADGLRLWVGEVAIPIEGRIRVLVGADEEHAKTVPAKTEHRFAESVRGAVEPQGESPKRPQLRRIGNDADVVVRGHLRRRAADGGQYREGSHGWALVTGMHGEAAELAAADAKVRLPSAEWGRRVMGLGFLVLALVPFGLQHGGEWLERRGNAQLRQCEMGGHRWLAAADWAARLEGAFPGFGQAALDRRHAVAGSTINGIAVCHISEEEAPPGWTEALVPLARERLPGLQEHPRFDGLRNRLEAALHEAGRDRAIVELQADLPRGGEITERVRAHLYLGDLEGALATWEEPGAEMPDLANGLLQKGTLLCMAGRTVEALEAFHALLERMPREGFRDEDEGALFRDGLCAIRAGDHERAARRAGELSTGAEAQLLEGKLAGPDELVAWTDRQPAEPTALLVAVALAEASQWDRLFGFLDRSSLGYRLESVRLVTPSADIFNEIYFPELSTRDLEELAEALDDPAQLSLPNREPDRSDALVSALRTTARREAARKRAGQIHRYLAMLRGRRWDPRADHDLDEAERRLGPEEVRPLRETLAFFHGDWDQTRDARDRDIRNLSRIYRGEEPESDYALETRGDGELGVRLLLVSGWGAEQAIATLYQQALRDPRAHDSSLTFARGWEQLQTQKQEASWSTIFYRLTHVIVHGERHGFDVGAHRDQLRALRELLNAQPDPYLLTGASFGVGL